MRIKSLIFFVAILCSTYAVQAQKKAKAPKPSLGKLETIINKAKDDSATPEDLLKGKEIADLAGEYEKTKGKSRAWYLIGMTYKFLYEKKVEVPGVTTEQVLQKASEGFSKAQELGKAGDTYSVFADTEFAQFSNGVLNQGIDNYNQGNNAEAAKYFEYAGLVKPNDTTGHLYAAAASQENDDLDRAIKNYRKVVKIAPLEKYYTVIAALQLQQKDYEGALATIKEAKAAVGEDNVELNKYEIDILIQTNQVEDAITKLDKAVQREPNNAKLYVRQGLLFDQLTTKERAKDEVDEKKAEEYQNKAEGAYLKAVELDEKDLTANFNYAVIVSNKANIYFKEYNLMTPQESLKRGEAVKKQGRDILQKAVPFMEKARDLSPEDKDVLYALQTFYNKLDDKEKLEQVNARLKELGYEN